MADSVNQVFSDLSSDDYVKQLGFEGPEAVIARQMLEQQKAQQQAQQKYAGLMDQQYNQLAGQTGMDPYAKASLMFQAAGALAAPTRTGGFGESLGALGTQIAGPLMQQAQAERSRQEKLQQLQLARAKMSAEMQGGPDLSKLMPLVKSQRDYEQDKSKLQSIEMPDGTKMPVIFKEGKAYDISGAPIDMGKISAQVSEQKASDIVPPEIQKLGPAAVKKWSESYATKAGGEYSSAQSSSDAIKMTLPILERAEDAYKKLGERRAIGPIQSSEAWRTTQSVAGAKSEILRQEYEAAAKELELMQAQIKMKGQGAITESERRILALTLPRLDAADPETGLKTLKMLRQQLNAAIEKPERIKARGSEEQTPVQTQAPASKPKVVDFGSLR